MVVRRTRRYSTASPASRHLENFSSAGIHRGQVAQSREVAETLLAPAQCTCDQVDELGAAAASATPDNLGGTVATNH
jgi:hypothetical protein